jgi:uncharacterized protein with NRDE domain
VLAANRDEFFDRPTAPASFWDDQPSLLAGRDLRGGGTWLGVTRSGRVAAVTNFRDPSKIRADAASRGDLVTGFLLEDVAAAEYAARVVADGERYNPFALLVADGSQMWFCSNEGPTSAPVQPGVHGLSNHLLDTAWPKVERGRQALSEVIRSADGSRYVESLSSMLADRSTAPDAELPSTGVGIERERVLSSMFIATPDYGTRSSTVLLIDREGEVTLAETTFSRTGESTHFAEFTFRIDH